MQKPQQNSPFNFFVVPPSPLEQIAQGIPNFIATPWLEEHAKKKIKEIQKDVKIPVEERKARIEAINFFIIQKETEGWEEEKQAEVMAQFRDFLLGKSKWNEDLTLIPWGKKKLVGDDIDIYLENMIDAKLAFDKEVHMSVNIGQIPKTLRQAWVYFCLKLKNNKKGVPSDMYLKLWETFYPTLSPEQTQTLNERLAEHPVIERDPGEPEFRYMGMREGQYPDDPALQIIPEANANAAQQREAEDEVDRPVDPAVSNNTAAVASLTQAINQLREQMQNPQQQQQNPPPPADQTLAELPDKIGKSIADSLALWQDDTRAQARELNAMLAEEMKKREDGNKELIAELKGMKEALLKDEGYKQKLAEDIERSGERTKQYTDLLQTVTGTNNRIGELLERLTQNDELIRQEVAATAGNTQTLSGYIQNLTQAVEAIGEENQSDEMIELKQQLFTIQEELAQTAAKRDDAERVLKDSLKALRAMDTVISLEASRGINNKKGKDIKLKQETLQKYLQTARNAEQAIVDYQEANTALQQDIYSVANEIAFDPQQEEGGPDQEDVQIQQSLAEEDNALANAMKEEKERIKNLKEQLKLQKMQKESEKLEKKLGKSTTSRTSETKDETTNETDVEMKEAKETKEEKKAREKTEKTQKKIEKQQEKAANTKMTEAPETDEEKAIRKAQKKKDKEIREGKKPEEEPISSVVLEEAMEEQHMEVAQTDEEEESEVVKDIRETEEKIKKLEEKIGSTQKKKDEQMQKMETNQTEKKKASLIKNIQAQKDRLFALQDEKDKALQEKARLDRILPSVAARVEEKKKEAIAKKRFSKEEKKKIPLTSKGITKKESSQKKSKVVSLGKGKEKEAKGEDQNKLEEAIRKAEQKLEPEYIENPKQKKSREEKLNDLKRKLAKYKKDNKIED